MHRFGLGLFIALLAVGCGGGQPLLHAVHPLSANQVSLGAGVSGQLAAGEASEAIEDARASASAQGGNQLAESALVQRGVLAYSSLAPGIAPWVSVRAGLGYDSDAGLTYTGRSTRLDARHVFPFGNFALSVGAGASAVLLRPGHDDPGTTSDGTTRSTGNIQGVDASDTTGFGLDLPIVFGWRSDLELVRLWVGARVGYERVFGEVIFAGTPDVLADLDVKRGYAGGLVGFAVGLGPVSAAIELDVYYQYLSGSLDSGLDRTDGALDGLSVTPGAALLTKF